MSQEIQVGKSKISITYILLIAALIFCGQLFKDFFDLGTQWQRVGDKIELNGERFVRFESATNDKIEKLEKQIKEIQKQQIANAERDARIEALLMEILKEKKGTK